MFRHQTCHPQGTSFVTSINYISTIAALVKINKVFKNIKTATKTSSLMMTNSVSKHVEA